MQYLVEEAISAGCEDIIIVTWRNKRAIEDHFDSNYELEQNLEIAHKMEYLKQIKELNSMANIVYVRQPYPKWDGEAILRAKPFIGDEPFLVLFGDDIVDSPISAACQLAKVYAHTNAPVIATVCVKDEEVSCYGIIEGEGSDGISFRVNKFLEKPKASQTTSRHGVVGKYILTHDIFSYLEQAKDMRKEGEIRLADAFELMRQKQSIFGVEIKGDRYDTGSKIWFLKATVAYALKNDEVRDEFIQFLQQLSFK